MRTLIPTAVALLALTAATVFAAPPKRAAPANSVAQSSGDDAIASVGPVTVSRQALQDELLNAYGLNTVIEMMELQLVKNSAAKTGVVVTADDVAAQTDRYQTTIFKDDAQLQTLRDHIDDLERAGKHAQADVARVDLKAQQKTMLQQLLDNKNVSPIAFELAMQRDAYLRKLSEPLIQGRVNDDAVKTAFGIMYGEKITIRHIELANLQEVTTAKRHLADGESFEQVAREMSRNPKTAPQGGLIPPFTRDAQFPQAFKDTAFSLKVGEVSDPVQTGDAYQLIKLESRSAPTTIKFDDVKESIRETLNEKLLEQTAVELRDRCQQQIFDEIQINDPRLKAQFDQKMAERRAAVANTAQMRREERANRVPTTESGNDLLPPATEPMPEPDMPSGPATRP